MEFMPKQKNILLMVHFFNPTIYSHEIWLNIIPGGYLCSGQFGLEQSNKHFAWLVYKRVWIIKFKQICGQ